MSVTLNAAVHLGKEYLENLQSTKNQPQRPAKQLFDVTKMLITNQKEIQGISDDRLAPTFLAKDNFAN